MQIEKVWIGESMRVERDGERGGIERGGGEGIGIVEGIGDKDIDIRTASMCAHIYVYSYVYY
jgi:hypothetical protein